LWDCGVPMMCAATAERLARLITGRRRAYGFWWVERFLAQMASAGGANPLTDVLAEWTARVFQAFAQEPDQPSPAISRGWAQETSVYRVSDPARAHWAYRQSTRLSRARPPA
jgi:hypothetical protein